MKKIITTVSIIVSTCYFSAFAQQAGVSPADSLNADMQRIAKPESQPGFIKFKEDVRIKTETLFTDHAAAFGLTAADKMIIFKTEKDELGFTHSRYQQYFKNIPIDGGIYIVHTNNNGVTYAANGKMLTGLDLNITPSISNQQAIDYALKYINAKEYKWQSGYWEKELKERTGKADSSYFPVPTLVIKEINNAARSTHLAYRIDIYTSSPDYSQRVFVDALTGKILEVFPLQSN